MTLEGKTLFISGGSRGVGLAIAIRAAHDGANVALIAKTGEPHPKLEGTVYTAAGQIEAARAFGMNRWQVFSRIRLPLAARLALPGVGNIWLNATKDASFISVLGSFPDLLNTSALAAGATRHYIFFYLVTAGLFLLLSLISMAFFTQLERRANRGVIRSH